MYKMGDPSKRDEHPCKKYAFEICYFKIGIVGSRILLVIDIFYF